MERFARSPYEVEARQWFPPGDPKHKVLELSVRYPEMDPLDDNECPHDDCAEHPRIELGLIGSAGDKFWVKTDNATARYLKPGDWIVRSPKYPWVEVWPDRMFWELYSGPI